MHSWQGSGSWSWALIETLYEYQVVPHVPLSDQFSSFVHLRASDNWSVNNHCLNFENKIIHVQILIQKERERANNSNRRVKPTHLYLESRRLAWISIRRFFQTLGRIPTRTSEQASRHSLGLFSCLETHEVRISVTVAVWCPSDSINSFQPGLVSDLISVLGGCQIRLWRGQRSKAIQCHELCRYLYH